MLLIFQHPDYGTGEGGFPNDIALIKLRTPADLSNKYVDTIAIGDKNDDFVGDECWITGWGGMYVLSFDMLMP